jgi:hypothetical protein
LGNFLGAQKHFTFMPVFKKNKTNMEHIHLPPKELIIRLIKDDLINNSLLNGFEMIGILTENYSLNLSDTIFKVMGISDDNDELFDIYLDKCKTLAELNISLDQNRLDKHAHEIFEVLMKSKE